LGAATQLYSKTMGLDANTVAAEISYQQFKDKNGSPFVAAVTPDGTPLLIYDAEKGWREATRGELGTKKGMLVGIQASGWKALQDKRYQAALISDANHLQLDDMCLWSVFEPTQGKINYTEWNKYLFSITLAREKQKTLSAGCGLIWGYPDYVPTWLKNSGYSQEQLLSIAEQHIEKFLTPVKNDVNRTTVVNEALPHLLGIPNFWIDTNYIDADTLLQRAFRKARQIAPNAELSLRDYSLEFAGYPRADEFFDLIKRLNEQERVTNGRNLIDVAEFQLPLFNPALIGKDPAMNPDNFVDPGTRRQMMDKLRDNIRRFKAIGVNVYITELLLPIENLPGTLKQKLALQASMRISIESAPKKELALVFGDRVRVTT
jgi:GH35 family endo-1,4-beta-xylanase